jgi:hypothetical protein
VLHLLERRAEVVRVDERLPPVSLASVPSVSCELKFAFNWLCIAAPL